MPAPQVQGPEADPTLIPPSNPPVPPARSPGSPSEPAAYCPSPQAPGGSAPSGTGAEATAATGVAVELGRGPALRACSRGQWGPKVQGAQVTPLPERRLRAGLRPGLSRGQCPQIPRRAQDCGTPTPTGERGTHPGWVQEVGREAAELTSHHLSLFCLQGFACKSHVNREYISWWGVCCLPSRPPLSYRGHLVVPGGPLCPSAGGSLPVLAWHSCPAVGCWMPRSRVLVLLDEVTQLQSGHAGAQPHASMGSPRVLTSRVFLLPRVK